MVLGITIGVAVAVAIDLANASSARAMELSTETLVGRATHQIFAPPAGLDENICLKLADSGLPIKAAPSRFRYRHFSADRQPSHAVDGDRSIFRLLHLGVI